MATKEVNIDSMSFAELHALVQQATAALNTKRVEEIKVLADAYSKKAEAAGFSIQEAIDALKPLLPKAAEKKTRAARGTATKKPPASQDHTGGMPVIGKSYMNPDTKEVTVKKEGGRPNTALVEFIKAGKTWAELEVK